MTPELVDVYVYREDPADKNNRTFLLLRRSPKVVYAGEWRIVAGKVQARESALAAAKRELLEETTAEPDFLWVLPDINHFFDARKNKMHFIPAFAARVNHQQQIRLNHEHTEFAWVIPQIAQKMLIWPEQSRLLALTQNILENDNLSSAWLF
ncbi:MAG: NUDIX domain-containing protein [Balneolales bacterium]|nr:NUDIX domain-containing protein [Balneolales bacterium]